MDCNQAGSKERRYRMLGQFDKHSISKPFVRFCSCYFRFHGAIMDVSGPTFFCHRLGSHYRLLWQKRQSFSLFKFIISTRKNF